LTSLLPYASVNGTLPEHSRNILSDLFHTIPELSQAATTKDGQDMIRKWLDDPVVASEVIGFWEEEFIID